MRADGVGFGVAGTGRLKGSSGEHVRAYWMHRCHRSCISQPFVEF